MDPHVQHVKKIPPHAEHREARRAARTCTTHQRPRLLRSRPLLRKFMQLFISSLAWAHRPIAAPAQHERLRLPSQTAECAAATQRHPQPMRQSSRSPHAPASPPTAPRCAFSQRPMPPASMTPMPRARVVCGGGTTSSACTPAVPHAVPPSSSRRSPRFPLVHLSRAPFLRNAT